MRRKNNNNKRRIFLAVLGSMAGGYVLARLIPVEAATQREVVDAELVRNIRSFLATAEEGLENLDVPLSSRASEETLTSIKNKIDLLKFDSEGRLLVNAGQIAVEAVKIKADDGSGSIAEIYRAGNALLVAIDQDKAGLAKEETLKKLTNALQSIASDKILVVPENPPNLDVKLSELKARLPRELELDDGSGTYDKIYRTGNAINIHIKGDDSGILKKADLKFDTDGYLIVNASKIANPSNLDVALSTRASESTLSGIKSQTDKLTFDANNYLYVNAAVVANPSNLDVPVSELKLRGSSIKTGSVSIGTSAAQIIGAEANRISICLINLGADKLYIGDSNVTVDTGFPLDVGAAITLNCSGAIYGVSEGSSEVRYIALYM